MSLPTNSTPNNNPSNNRVEEEINSLELNSLLALPNSIEINTELILKILKERFLESKNFINLNSNILLSINSFKENDNKALNQILNEFKQDFYNFGKEEIKGNVNNNHLFNISTKSYFYMLRTGQDQSILLS